MLFNENQYAGQSFKALVTFEKHQIPGRYPLYCLGLLTHFIYLWFRSALAEDYIRQTEPSRALEAYTIKFALYIYIYICARGRVYSITHGALSLFKLISLRPFFFVFINGCAALWAVNNNYNLRARACGVLIYSRNSGPLNVSLNLWCHR